MEGIQLQTLDVGADGGISLLRLKGYVDATTAPELHRAVTRLIQEERFQIIVDLGAVNYISSAGWGVFVGEIRGLRESGGNLKIVHMTPDVREVFEMLEFNRILASYDSLEEAMDDFDVCLGYDLTKSDHRTANGPIDLDFQPVVLMSSAPAVASVTSGGNGSTIQVVQSGPLVRRQLEDINLPLTEKIRKIVLENPNNGALAIKRALNSPRFSYTKLGYFKIRSILKRLNLDSKEKRYRYYRSR